MSTNPDNITVQTRDVLKSGINLPLLGNVGLGALAVIGVLGYMFLRRGSRKVVISG